MIIIKITQDHIDTGTLRSAFKCAIAQSLNEEFEYDIMVARFIRIGKDVYKTTPEVRDWIRKFDKGLNVKPITIALVADLDIQKEWRNPKTGRTYALVGTAQVHQ